MRIIGAVLLVFILTAGAVHAQNPCYTPTAYPSRTPMLTPSPFPTDYVLPEDNTLVEINSGIISFTDGLSDTVSIASTYVPSLSQTISDTAIAFPVHVVRGLMTEFPFYTTGIVLVFGFMIYRFVLLGVFAIIKQSGGVRNALAFFWALVQPYLDWKTLVVIAILTAMTTLIYQCNVYVE